MKNLIKTFYYFAGGQYNDQYMTLEQIWTISNGKFTRDYTREREAGALVPRAELDLQPKVDGYVGPMYDGKRWLTEAGEIKHIKYGTCEHYLTEEQRAERERQGAGCEICQILRYETQAVYDRSNN